MFISDGGEGSEGMAKKTIKTILPDDDDIRAYEKRHNTLLVAGLLAVCVMIATAFGSIAFITGPAAEQKAGLAAQQQQPQWQTIEERYTFQPYLSNQTRYANTQALITGTLEYRIEEGAHRQYIVDDDGFAIQLLKVTPQQLSTYFTENATTPGVFTVNGTFKRTYAGFTIDTKAITPAERGVTAVALAS